MEIWKYVLNLFSYPCIHSGDAFCFSQISARLDCVENLTRQRHDRDQTENQQNAATVHGQLFRAGWLSSARCSTAKSRTTSASRVVYQMHVVAISDGPKFRHPSTS